MEVFVDFGLFELLAALGLAAVAKAIYSYKLIGILFLIASIGTSIALIFIVQGEAGRWLAAFGLAAALVNASVVAGGIQRDDVPTLKVAHWG